MPLRKDISERRRRANVNYSDFWRITNPKLIDYINGGLHVYRGKDLGKGVGTPAQIRTCDPMDVNNPLALTQFEVRIQDSGVSNTVTIGVCDNSYPMDFLPGWEAPTGMQYIIKTIYGERSIRECMCRGEVDLTVMYYSHYSQLVF